MHIMIDLETMGQTINAPIVALGACRFDIKAETIDTFYRVISLESAIESGAVMDAATVLWWLKQDDDARKVLTEPDCTLQVSLKEFTTWCRETDIDGIWGNGAAFDNAILAHTYYRLRLDPPWTYHDDRCYRTVRALSNIPFLHHGTAHNALDDALAQANHLRAILNTKEL